MEVVHRLAAGSQLEGYCCSSGEGTLAWAGRRLKGKGRGLGTGYCEVEKTWRQERVKRMPGMSPHSVSKAETSVW